MNQFSKTYNNISGRISEFLATGFDQFVSQYRIYTKRLNKYLRVPTKDWGRPDYQYWRRAESCQVAGLEVSGLFIKPVVSKMVAWSLGRLPDFECNNESSQKALKSWLNNNYKYILDIFTDSLTLGDCFAVVNSDLTITIVPPEVVFPIVSEDNYGLIMGWRIRQVLPHPENASVRMVIEDEYYADRRINRIEYSDGRVSQSVYPNLLGRIPVIHVANGPKSGETFGHPEIEALVPTFHRYGQVLDSAIEGNVLQGRPTPVLAFESLQSQNAFWKTYGQRKTQVLPDGSREETSAISIDLSELLTFSGADFKYESPGSFAQDTEILLGLLFYLILEHTELPEFVFGNAIASSKASAEAQVPVLEEFIRKRRHSCSRWVLDLIEVVLAYLSITTPGVTSERPELNWPKLTQNGRLTLDSVNWAFNVGLIDERTALLLLPVDIENPDDVLEQARIDREQRQEFNLQYAARMAKSADKVEAGMSQAEKSESTASGTEVKRLQEIQIEESEKEIYTNGFTKEFS